MKKLYVLLIVGIMSGFGLLISGALQGCSTDASPQSRFDTVKLAYTAIVSVYDGICLSTPHPKSCDDPKAKEIELQAKNIFGAAMASWQSHIDNSTLDEAAIGELTTQIVTASVSIQRLILALRSDIPEA